MGLCFSIISQGTIGVIETCGKYEREADAGCNFLIPCFQTVAYEVNLRTQQIIIKVDTKTSDNVFCTIEIAIFYKIKPANVQNFVYEISDFKTLISSSVQNCVRSFLCTFTLDEAFIQKQEISNQIHNMLNSEFGKYGITFEQVGVNDIEPNKQVRDAMNKKLEAEKLREANIAQAEAEKFTQITKAEARAITMIKEAEADAQVKKLQGVGIASQREEIAKGFGNSLKDIVDLQLGLDPNEVTGLIQNMLYIDMMKHVGSSSRSNLVFLPADPKTSMNSVEEKIMIPSMNNMLGSKYDDRVD